MPAGAGKPVKDADTLKAEREELAKQKMEQVLEQLKTDAAKLPEAQRKKAAHELRMLASDKEAIGKVLSEMGQGLNSIPKNDRAEVKSKAARGGLAANQGCHWGEHCCISLSSFGHV